MTDCQLSLRRTAIRVLRFQGAEVAWSFVFPPLQAINCGLGLFTGNFKTGFLALTIGPPGIVVGELRKSRPGCWSGLDLNPRDPSISLPVIMVSIVQPMKTRLVSEQTRNLSHGHAFR